MNHEDRRAGEGMLLVQLATQLLSDIEKNEAYSKRNTSHDTNFTDLCFVCDRNY